MKLRCPVCRDAFRWQPEKKWPEECPLCDAFIGTGRNEDEIVMPSIGKMREAIGGKMDVYRQIEQSSEHRMHAAAEAAGVPVAEMSNLKTTNLSDRRDVEIAEAPVINDVSAQMERMKQINPNASVGFGASAGAEFAVGTSTGAITVNGQTFTGIAPRAGMDALARTQRIFGTK